MPGNNTGTLEVLENRKLAGQYRGKLPKGVELRWAVEKEHIKQLIEKSKDLKACDKDSIQAAALNAAMIGLSFNPNLGEAYLIPRKIFSKAQNGKPKELIYTKAQLYVGYKGMQTVVNRTGTIKWIKARVVYANEPFELIEGVHTDIRHKIEKDAKKRGHMVGAYCIAMTKDGEPLVEYMDSEQIGRVRACSESESSDYSPWNTFPEQQWKKTVVRRAWNQWPKTPMLDTLVSYMNNMEGIDVKKAEKEVEAVRVINEDQSNELHDIVVNNLPNATPAKWLSRLAGSFGCSTIEELPVDRFDEAKASLESGINAKLDASK